MIYIFLFFLCLCCAVYYRFVPQTTLGDKLGIKEQPERFKLQAPNLPSVKLNYFYQLVSNAADNGAVIQTGHVSLIAIASAIFTFVAAAFGFRSVILAAITATVAFFVVPKLYAIHSINAQREKITEQLSDAILSLTSALRAGKTLVDAIGTAAEDIPAPLGAEFRKVYDSVKHGGEELSSALNKMLVRSGNHYILMKLIFAINITRQTGGNIAAALEGVGMMIENERFTQEFAKSHSSHGKMVAIVFNLIVLFVTVNIARTTGGAFAEFFLSDMKGRIMLFGCIAIIISGWFVIYRMLSTIFDI